MRALTRPVRLVVADDHALLRDVLSRSLSGYGYEVVGQAGDGRAAVAQVEEHAPDAALLDVSMPVMDGLAALRTIHARHPGLPVLVLTMHDDPDLAAEAERAGASGFLTKECSTEDLIDAIDAAVAVEDDSGTGPQHRAPSRRTRVLDPETQGELSISDRELEVLRLVARGASPVEIARTLYISHKTVKNHLASIYHKLDARDRTQAVLRAIRIGLVGLD